MERQRNGFQMKEQEKSSKKELNDMEEGNLPDIEFKKIVIRMLKELSENYNKEIANIKKDMETIKRSSQK